MAKTIYREEYRRVVSQLREIREILGISQTDLATRLGRNQQWISQMEIGSRRLDVVEFAEVCIALDVDPSTAIAPIMAALSHGSQTARPHRRSNRRSIPGS